jgi:hypothetical protein
MNDCCIGIPRATPILVHGSFRRYGTLVLEDDGKVQIVILKVQLPQNLDWHGSSIMVRVSLELAKPSVGTSNVENTEMRWRESLSNRWTLAVKVM